MAGMDATERLDRHALVMAIWTPSAFVAATLLHMGLATGASGWWIVTGFAVIHGAFVGHIIVNAVFGTGFTTGETALGVAAYAAALVALLVSALFGSVGIDGRLFLPVGLGLASLLAAVVLYLVIAFGPRRAFRKFDVIRDNNPRPTSWLPHRGGRR